MELTTAPLCEPRNIVPRLVQAGRSCAKMTGK